ncbi:MAG: hypothetical protein U0936_19990 [Planctomycetaceae bacterium]
MDGLIKLRAGSQYRLFAELRNALLERYAVQHLADQRNIRSGESGMIFVTGDGDSASNLTGKASSDQSSRVVRSACRSRNAGGIESAELQSPIYLVHSNML